MSQIISSSFTPATVIYAAQLHGRRITRLLKVVVLGTILSLLLSSTARVQAQSALDGFDPNANGTIRVVVVQPDGKILIGGDFTTLSPNGGIAIARNHIARLNSDGTLDAGFDPNADDSIYALALQSDGRILAGGLFTSIGGQPRNRIARLDSATGSADLFNPNVTGIVLAIAVQTDDKVLVGGGFVIIGGQSHNHFARLNTDGTPDTAFSPSGANSNVNAIVVQADGKILAGGDFNGPSSIGGQTRNRIARLEATTGMADSFDPNANNQVYSIAVQADGKVLVGGAFNGANSIGGQTRSRVARLNGTTGLADSFDPNASDEVRSLVPQMDGKILVGGFFASVGGQMRDRIARLDATTGLADSFDPKANSPVRSIAIQADGKILAGGDFTTLTPNGGAMLTRSHIARLETDGRLDQTLNPNILGGTVNATAVQADGKILIGGQFVQVLGVPRNNIARLNADGTLDPGFNPNADGEVLCMVVQPDGGILVGGSFNGANSIGGQTRNRIARLDPTTGLADSFDPNANNDVWTIVLQGDNQILAGGAFTNIGGANRNRLARLNPTTGSADSFDPNANNTVRSIAVQADGRILAGGEFSGANSIGGQMRNRIARLDATTGAADSFDPNADGPVYSIAVQPDAKILTGGAFSGIGGLTRRHIARLDAASGLADSFDPNANLNVFSIATQADGKIVVGGSFSGPNSIGGQPRHFIARLDATTGLADSFNPNSDNVVSSVAVQTDGKILVGGSFNNIGGNPRNRLARLTNDTPALQSLGVTQHIITWNRAGSSPQFARVTFEYSTDNVSYSALGNGTAAGSNWSLSGLNLPIAQTFYIRARGYHRGGLDNGSESIAETVRNAFLTGAEPTPTPTPTPTATPTPSPTPACSPNPVVTTNADSGPGSLRQAINDACPGSIITFDMSQVVSPITLTSGALGTDKGLTISGPGASQLAVVANGGAVFQAAPVFPTVVMVSGLALKNGASPMGGVSHSGSGTLNIAGCFVSNNVSSTSGGGVWNQAGIINIIDSTLDSNSTPGSGGGVLNGAGTINIVNSTLSNNSSFFAGGGAGLCNSSTGTVNLTNCTISNNSASAFGGPGRAGGILNQSTGTVNITNCTIANNTADIGGGIVNLSSGLVQIRNSIVGLNTGGTSSPDVNGAFTTQGHNLIGRNDGSTGFTPGANGDLVGTSASPLDPELGALANNGGPTMTRALSGTSPALNAGDNGAVTSPPFIGPPFFDQRGTGFPRIVASIVDIGSFEASAATPTPTATATPTATPTPAPTATPTPSPTPTATPKATPTATATPTPSPAPTATPTPTPSPAHALNISTRMRVDTGNNVLIGGFIVTGNAPKKVVVRGIGPSLAQFGIGDLLADPTLELRDSNGGSMPNDDWQDNAAQATQLTALHLAPNDPKESALVATLQPGGYTAILAGKDNGTGVGLVEVYDVDAAADSQLANISTRGFVLINDNVMFGGFILGGNNNTRVVVRGRGPSLAQLGLNPVLADPTLALHDGNGLLLVANDDWQDDPAASQLAALGLAPSDPKEPAIFRSLPVGAFTAILAGKDGGTGIGLVEVYNVQ